MSSISIKKALILPGGGGWGRVQAAELFTLHNAGVLDGVDGIFSNSAGSLNAALYCMGLMGGLGANLNKEAWMNIQANTDIISPDFIPIAADPAMHPFEVAGIVEGVTLGAGAFDNSPLRGMVRKYVGTTTTADLEAKLGVTWRAMCYHAGEGRGRFLNGQFYHMAVASSSIEVAFPAHLGLGDGGPVANCPAIAALDAGARQVVIAYCGSEGPDPTDDALWLDDTTQDPKMLAKQMAGSLLGNLTTINEAQADRELDRAEAAGVQVVRCYSRTPVVGSILQFVDPGDVRWNQGLAAAELAIADAKAYGWALR
jgi:predicted acylesterase/phospholipase RssA